MLEQAAGFQYLSDPRFDIAVGSQLIVAALVYFDHRRLALLGTVGILVTGLFAHYYFPLTLQFLYLAVGILQVAALLMPPAAPPARRLVHWGHAAVLLLAAGAAQAAAAAIDQNSFSFSMLTLAVQHDTMTTPLTVAALLAAASLALALLLRLSRYFVLLLAALLYPCIIQATAVYTTGTWAGLTASPRSSSLLAIQYGPLLVLVAVAVVAATGWRFPGTRPSSDPDEPTVA